MVNKTFYCLERLNYLFTFDLELSDILLALIFAYFTGNSEFEHVQCKLLCVSDEITFKLYMHDMCAYLQ